MSVNIDGVERNLSRAERFLRAAGLIATGLLIDILLTERRYWLAFFLGLTAIYAGYALVKDVRTQLRRRHGRPSWLSSSGRRSR
ncbi:hypothetical protein [Actinoplanes awajinensis]|uniref:Uncharacterized protein n=1 Tax=Actinoplanes awajinensis subsp. mycoplanecinus TaxID=135947 RepID=A0A101JJP5_9ACTN|nr:hypothetical protein [Actinoplanes awajinensis]KUL28024.1 hypothetical protein ADL15_33000 [Actinoplanes awajinensis subsp. mycoplanecinus]